MTTRLKVGHIYASENGSIWKCTGAGRYNYVGTEIHAPVKCLFDPTGNKKVGWMGRSRPIGSPGNGYRLVREIEP